MTTAEEDYLACIDLAGALLDEVPEYSMEEGHPTGLLLMHGLAMYARDTSRDAVILLRAGRTFSPSALTRVVLEHAMLAQWLHGDLEVRGQLLFQQSNVEHERWFKVIVDAGVGRPVREGSTGTGSKPKNAASVFETPKNLFGDTHGGRLLYPAYRHFSRYLHPTAATFARYTEGVPNSLIGKQAPYAEEDPESVAFYLACALVICALSYLDALGAVEACGQLQEAASAAKVPTTLT